MSPPDVTSREQWLEARRRRPHVHRLTPNGGREPRGPLGLSGSRPRDNDLNTPAGFANYPGLVSLHTPARHS